MKPSLKNASIGRILMMSYVSIIVLFVISICVAVFGVHQNSAMTTEFYEQPYRVSKSAPVAAQHRRADIEPTQAVPRDGGLP